MNCPSHLPFDPWDVFNRGQGRVVRNRQLGGTFLTIRPQPSCFPPCDPVCVSSGCWLLCYVPVGVACGHVGITGSCVGSFCPSWFAGWVFPIVIHGSPTLYILIWICLLKSLLFMLLPLCLSAFGSIPFPFCPPYHFNAFTPSHSQYVIHNMMWKPGQPHTTDCCLIYLKLLLCLVYWGTQPSHDTMTVCVFSSACYSLLVSWGWVWAPAVPGNPPSKAAFSTWSRLAAGTKSRSARTLAGSSSRSFLLRRGRMTHFTPALWAASTLSLIPPTWGTQTNPVAYNRVHMSFGNQNIRPVETHRQHQPSQRDLSRHGDIWSDQSAAKQWG